MTALYVHQAHHEAYTNRTYVLGDDAVAAFNLGRRLDFQPLSWYDSSTASKATSEREIEDHASADLRWSDHSRHSHTAK
jgi:hypothetical protein